MAGDFTRSSALAPEPWDRGRAEKEARIMFGNAALKPVAAALAGAHPRALDYIRQAPVIVLAAAVGRPHRMNTGRLRTALRESLGARCRRGERLREVMKAYGCAPQLRALHPKALALVRWPVIRLLCGLPPSRLAPIIPTELREQDAWLKALTYWVDQTARRGHRDTMEPHFEWAARSLSFERGAPEEVVTAVADFFIEAGRPRPRGDARIDPRWTFAQAATAAARWHEALNRELAERRTWSHRDDDFDRPVDYAPLWNEPFELGDFEVVPLRSGRELSQEGAAMHHCVGSYSREVRSGMSRIFSLRRDGRRVATVELGGIGHGRPSLYQVRGPCNAMPGREVIEVARYLERDAKLRFAETRSAPKRSIAGTATITGADGTPITLRGEMRIAIRDQIDRSADGRR